MAESQTAEEKELIAKWNAGDYTAEGWVNNTDGLTEEALRGLEEYIAKKYGINDDGGGDDVGGEEVPIDTNTTPTPSPQAVADVRMGVLSGNVNNVPTVTCQIYHDFGNNFRTYRARFQRQGGVGQANIAGQVTWVPSSVSATLTPARFHITGARQAALDCYTSSVPPQPRLQFTGPAGRLNFANTFTGSGGYIRA